MMYTSFATPPQITISDNLAFDNDFLLFSQEPRKAVMEEGDYQIDPFGRWGK